MGQHHRPRKSIAAHCHSALGIRKHCNAAARVCTWGRPGLARKQRRAVAARLGNTTASHALCPNMVERPVVREEQMKVQAPMQAR